MKNKIFKTIGFKIIALYILLSFINLSFVISIIFENQTDLISKNMMLESEKQISQLIGALKKFNIEMKQGNLFKVKDEKENLLQLIKIIGMHYKNFLVVSEKNSIVYKSSSAVSLSEGYKEDIQRSLTASTFSGKDYYLRIDDNDKIVNFYIPLNEFYSGNSVLLVKKNIGSLDDSLTDLYKQAIYIIIVVCSFHIIFAACLYKYIIHPIRIIDEAAQRISRGDLDTRVPITGNNYGFDSLVRTFNSMAASIHENINSISAEMESAKQIKKGFEKNFTRDELTGLLNNYYLSERIEEELKLAKFTQKGFSLCLIDIDDFDKVNEIYGKQTCDIILLETAKKITNNCGSSDIVARSGDEEFAVLSPGSEKENATVFAEKIRSMIEEKEIITPDGKFSITVSIGISYIDARLLNLIDNKNDVIEPARSALKQAKESGKNRIKLNP